jgi:citronellol/citronellal dehydrogenase
MNAVTTGYGSVFRPGGFEGRVAWGDFVASPEVQAREAVRPFDGFPRYEIPKVFRS